MFSCSWDRLRETKLEAFEAGLTWADFFGISPYVSNPKAVTSSTLTPASPAKDSQAQDVYSIRYYKVVQNRTEVYDIVTRVFHRKGWEELPHGLGLSNAWNLCWTWSKPKLDYSRLCVSGGLKQGFVMFCAFCYVLVIAVY